MPRVPFLLLGLALFAPVLSGAQEPAPRPASPKRTIHEKLKPCKIGGLDEEVLCGTLPVWENRTTRAGRKIALKIVALPAQSSNPAPDPLFYITGGPGYSSTVTASGLGQFLGEIRKNRDLVFVDQRGSGESHPLKCPLPGSEENLQGLLSDLFPIDILRSCLPELQAKADLTQYTTAIAMDDLDEVREWLGYERINLFGGSYGTRAAQAYMRQHPGHVRSAVLAGVMTADARMPLYIARQAQESMEKIFDDCMAEESCRTAFPNLRNEFRSVIDRLRKGPVRQTVPHPRTGKPVELSIAHGPFTTTLRSMQYSPFKAIRIPLYIHKAAQGDYAPMIREALEYFNDTEWAIGQYLSITCAEDVARFGPQDVPAQIAGTYQGDDRIRQQVAACAFWPKAQVAANFWDPVRSTAPALILTGWLDPATPPEWAVEVNHQLPNSLNVVIRDASHGPGGLSNPTCYPKLITDFVVNGTAVGLDTSCTKEMKRPAFLVKEEEEKKGG
jgi:pimeloyl-ACP methyl ester carboxylesterase